MTDHDGCPWWHSLTTEQFEEIRAECEGQEDMDDDDDIYEEPRSLDEIQAAEKEMFEKVWYERSMRFDEELLYQGKTAELEEHRRVAGPARERIEKTYGDLGPFDAFELGMLNGKLSALRWVLGSEWDFLDA